MIEIRAEYAKLAAASRCPKSNGMNRAADPAEQAELMRYRSIMRHIRNGKTFEEAVEYYDRPRGVCSCGAPARTKSGRVCDPCYRASMCRAVKAYRAADRPPPRVVTDGGKPCVCGCGVLVYHSAQKRTPECAAKYKRDKDRARAAELYKAKTGKPTAFRESAVADRRDEREKAAMVPVKMAPVDVDGLKVTRVPPVFPTSLRDLFGTGRTAAD